MTRKMMLIAGAATMALSAPAMAGPKGGHGQSAERHQQRGGGGERQARSIQRSGGDRQVHTMQRAGGGERHVQRSIQRAKGGDMRRSMQRVERAPRVERHGRSIERQQTRTMERARPMRIERQAKRVERPVRVERHVERNINRPMRIERQALAPRIEERRFDGRHPVSAFGRETNFGQQVAARAHMRNELRKERHDDWKLGERFDRNWAERTNYMPLRYASRYEDTPDWMYRYDGDRIYRVNRSNGLIGGIIPLLGGAYSVGQPLPGYYSSSYVPLGYRSLYYDTPDHYYRYGDGGLYQVNSNTGLITSLVALLTGTNLGIGQMLPTAYNTYNVPYDYRDRYYDTNDAWYRYNNGYIYQVDPYSRMVEASYPMYGNGYYDVGQPWPAAYPSYNVPDPYRSTYYDTPQWDYRYANGAIYQVNPQTQLINALVSLVTGSPMNVGQMMPSGYGVYNVPLQYRSQYFDTADNSYRYGDGNIYRVDPYTGRIAEVIPAYV